MNSTALNRAVVWTVGGKIGESVIRFTGNLLLTRLLAPDQVGLMALAQSVILMMELLTDPGLRTALIQQKETGNDRLLTTAWLIATGRGFLLTLLMFPLASVLAVAFSQPSLKPVLWMLSISFLINGAANPAVAVVQKSLNFKKVILPELTGQVIGALVTLCLAMFWPSVWALVAGFLVSSFSRFIGSWVIHPFRPTFVWDSTIAPGLFRQSQLLLMNTVVTWTAMNMDRFIIGKVAGVDMLGVYVIALNLILIVEQVLVQIFSRVTFSAISSANGSQTHIKSLTMKAMLIAGGAGIPALVFLIISSDHIISLLYTDSWSLAGPLMVVIGIRSMFNVLSAVFSGTLLAMNQTKVVTGVMVIGLGVNVAVSAMAWLQGWSVLSLAAGFIAGSAVISILLGWKLLRLSPWLAPAFRPGFLLAGITIGVGIVYSAVMPAGWMSGSPDLLFLVVHGLLIGCLCVWFIKWQGVQNQW